MKHLATEESEVSLKHQLVGENNGKCVSLAHLFSEQHQTQVINVQWLIALYVYSILQRQHTMDAVDN